MFYKLGTCIAYSEYYSYARILVRYYDSAGNLIREDIIADVSTRSTSMVYWSGGYVAVIPSNTASIAVFVAHRAQAQYTSRVTAWFDNVVFAEDGSISIHATPILFYNVTASYEIPINKTLPASTKAVYVSVAGTSPPTNTSVTPTLYYDTSTASPSTTSVLTVNSSVDKLVYSGSSAANNEQKFSVDAYAIYIVQPPNTFVDLILVWLNVNTSPQKPEAINFSIPSPATNYATYTASLLVQHSTTSALNTTANFSLSISGDAQGISYAKIAITVKDPNNAVVYDDYFEIQDGSITKAPETLTVLPNTTYSITYTVNITASPAQNTYINLLVQYTTQPQVS